MGLSPLYGFVHCSEHFLPSTVMFVTQGASGGPVEIEETKNIKTFFSRRGGHVCPQSGLNWLIPQCMINIFGQGSLCK